ncbi:hypothetical protein [Bradyrhizobium sp. 2]|uniref:hypothetical protein n=1 Tax=Bradyrhizobium sp. 2 TaxID=190045 RepID=UPI001FFB1EAE|nr:hypothetical protein [Bradyrhizobium sp. 2]
MLEPLIEVVLSVAAGPCTGTDGLIPAPPSSVAPSGIPTRPTVDAEGSGDAAVMLPLQVTDEPPDSPPPSNGLRTRRYCRIRRNPPCFAPD